MKKNFKRLFTLVLALTLVIGALSGCKSGSSGKVYLMIHVPGRHMKLISLTIMHQTAQAGR